MRFDADPNVVLSEVFQLRNELSDLGEVVSNERLTTIILHALSKKKYATIKKQAIRDPDLCLEELTNMMKTIFINHSERSSVSKRSQESYRKSRDSVREPTKNGSETEMVTGITCHNCKRPGHKKKDCNQLNKRPDESSNMKNGKRKWCPYHHNNGHSNKDCYQQQFFLFFFVCISLIIMVDRPQRARLPIPPTATLSFYLWKLRIFKSLPGSRLTNLCRDGSSALLQLVNR